MWITVFKQNVKASGGTSSRTQENRKEGKTNTSKLAEHIWDEQSCGIKKISLGRKLILINIKSYRHFLCL